MDRLLYWVWLTTTLNLSYAKISNVYRRFTPEEAFFATPDELERGGVARDTIDLLSEHDLKRSKNIIDKCEKLGIKIITANSRLYPRQLEVLHDRPYILYVKGNLDCLKNKTAAIVGTRRSSFWGEQLTREISEELISEGFTLMSGVADGIDSVSAKVSIERAVPFVCVLGVDIDKYYPASNKALIEKIAERGAVISEYPPDTGARYFGERNRIIAGLSDEVYVTEAPDGSGALITAQIARRYGIPVYAPNFDGLSFEGCRALIKKGAVQIAGEDMTEKKKAPPVLDGARLYIYERLLKESVGEEELVSEKYPITEILTALTELELDGIIKALPGGKYKLIK